MYGLVGLLAFAFPVAVVVLVVLAFRQSATNQRLETTLRDLALRLGALENRPGRDVGALANLRAEAQAAATAPSVTAAPVTTIASAATAEPAERIEIPHAPEALPSTPPPEAPEAEQPEDEPFDLPPPPPSEPTEPPKRFDWERFVGLRLPVWLGAIALSIAGFFFVSYAIESGFFTPEMRVLSAAAASLAFLAGAEFVRRRVKGGNVDNIASALGAASIATAYATAYLATKTYGLVPSGAGFIITIGVSLLAIAIALAYGQVVALVGILGGYIAPIVYGGGDPNAPFLFAYVAALTAVSFAVIRLKNWWNLSVVGLLGPAFWGFVWMFSPGLFAETYWGSAFLLSLPLIVLVASWPGWREDGDVVGLRGLTGAATPERGSLIAAVILAAVGFVLFLMSADFAIGYWQGFVIYAAAAVAIGFVSPPHRALQLPILIAASIALLLWTGADQTSALVVTGLFALVFGYGALDQFRRMREPALWATVFAFVVTSLFAIALFKVTGWDGALENKHLWALGALAIAGGLIALLRYYGPRLEPELVRSQVYAAWGGATTTLVSLAIVLELDPLYFPAASAIAILGLAAVHTRAPVRGLRVLAAVYLAAYGLLILGAYSYTGYVPGYFRYVFVRDIWDHALVLMVLPGIAMLAAGTLFQRSRPVESKALVAALDVAGILVEIFGLFYLLAWPHAFRAWSETLVLAAWITAPELLLAAIAVYLGRRYDRQAAYTGGVILAGLVALIMLTAIIAPLFQFWPPFAVPGTVVFNITLLAYGLPALLLFAIGWYLRQDARNGMRLYGITLSIFAVVVTYTMLMVDIRQAYHLGAPTLEGDMSQSEYYAYSIATLIFGLALLIGGVALKHRGARAVSFFFVLAATIKVFLFDASELTGLWRVLSFLLMGLSFLGISWAYARFVFGIGLSKSMPPPQPPSPET